jgi:hypothetical protein
MSYDRFVQSANGLESPSTSASIIPTARTSRSSLNPRMERSWELAVSPPAQPEDTSQRHIRDRVLRPGQRLAISRLNYGSPFSRGPFEARGRTAVADPACGEQMATDGRGADSADKYQSLEIVDGNRPADA